MQPRPIVYPESDGQPMAETEDHADAMWDLIHTIRHWLDDPERWHVSGNQLFYWVEGDPTQSFSPDVYVLRGVAQWPRRRIWKLWEEPTAVPALVIELMSVSSVARDLGTKRVFYEHLGVDEYVVFDVLREASRSPVRIWRRSEGRLVEQAEWRSEVLGLRFEPEDWRLRLVAPTGERVLNPLERAEAERERAEAERERAEKERRRADAEQARARAETARREDVEAKLAEALAKLERLRSD